jgi:hypothetical protein
MNPSLLDGLDIGSGSISKPSLKAKRHPAAGPFRICEEVAFSS